MENGEIMDLSSADLQRGIAQLAHGVSAFGPCLHPLMETVSRLTVMKETYNNIEKDMMAEVRRIGKLVCRDLMTKVKRKRRQDLAEVEQEWVHFMDEKLQGMEERLQQMVQEKLQEMEEWVRQLEINATLAAEGCPEDSEAAAEQSEDSEAAAEQSEDSEAAAEQSDDSEADVEQSEDSEADVEQSKDSEDVGRLDICTKTMVTAGELDARVTVLDFMVRKAVCWALPTADLLLDCLEK